MNAHIATAADGSIELDDLRAKLADHGPRVAAIMITYPSTHGVYEEHVREVCDLVHAAGGIGDDLAGHPHPAIGDQAFRGAA